MAALRASSLSASTCDLSLLERRGSADMPDREALLDTLGAPLRGGAVERGVVELGPAIGARSSAACQDARAARPSAVRIS
jgi:hypothetical protein